jgi:hypothetical protein
MLISFAGEKYQTDTDLKTVIIGPDGTVKRPAGRRSQFPVRDAVHCNPYRSYGQADIGEIQRAELRLLLDCIRLLLD